MCGVHECVPVRECMCMNKCEHIYEHVFMNVHESVCKCMWSLGVSVCVFHESECMSVRVCVWMCD